MREFIHFPIQIYLVKELSKIKYHLSLCKCSYLPNCLFFQDMDMILSLPQVIGTAHCWSLVLTRFVLQTLIGQNSYKQQQHWGHKYVNVDSQGKKFEMCFVTFLKKTRL